MVLKKKKKKKKKAIPIPMTIMNFASKVLETWYLKKK